MADNTIQNNDPRTDEQIQLRRLIVKKVYLLASSFVVAFLVQCLLLLLYMLLFDPVTEIALLKAMVYAGLWMLISCSIMFRSFPSMLMTPCVNWIFIGVIVEAFTFVMLAFARIWSAFCVIVPINIIAMAALVVIASKMPCDLTKIGLLLNVIGFVMLCIFVVILVFGIGIYFIFTITWIIYDILILAWVIMFTMYYAQLIQGGRYNELELNQVKLAALVLFFCLMVMNISLTIFYFVLDLYINCDDMTPDCYWIEVN